MTTTAAGPVTNLKQTRTTVTTFSTPGQPVVSLPRGARSVKVVVNEVEVHEVVGVPTPKVFVSGPYLLADGTCGAYRQNHLTEVPEHIQALIDDALVQQLNAALAGVVHEVAMLAPRLEITDDTRG